jgi:hypothetical protein
MYSERQDILRRVRHLEAREQEVAHTAALSSRSARLLAEAQKSPFFTFCFFFVFFFFSSLSLSLMRLLKVCLFVFEQAHVQPHLLPYAHMYLHTRPHPF